MRELLPSLTVDLDAHLVVEPARLFSGVQPCVWLEVGFGGGEHLAALARQHPDIGMIGVEPFKGGVAKLLRRIEEEGLTNIRIIADDARLVLRRLPPAALGRVFVLFPDPWPKTRHHKRRIITSETLTMLAHAMADDAELRIATDDPGLLRWMLACLLAHEAFSWQVERAADWRQRPCDWPATRYEEKAVEAGRRPVFLRFRRRPRVGGMCEPRAARGACTKSVTSPY